MEENSLGDLDTKILEKVGVKQRQEHHLFESVHVSTRTSMVILRRQKRFKLTHQDQQPWKSLFWDQPTRGKCRPSARSPDPHRPVGAHDLTETSDGDELLHDHFHCLWRMMTSAPESRRMSESQNANDSRIVDVKRVSTHSRQHLHDVIERKRSLTTAGVSAHHMSRAIKPHHGPIQSEFE